MLTKIKNFYHKIVFYLSQLKDVRVVGLLLFLAVVLMISWSGVKVIDKNYELQKQIARLEQENEVKRLANENRKLENKYYETPQYLELAARENFGLAAPGETLLIVPKQVALKHALALEPAEQTMDKPEDKRPVYQRNFEAWMDFLFNR